LGAQVLVPFVLVENALPDGVVLLKANVDGQ
jgi:hypothetical protein